MQTRKITVPLSVSLPQQVMDLLRVNGFALEDQGEGRFPRIAQPWRLEVDADENFTYIQEITPDDNDD